MSYDFSQLNDKEFEILTIDLLSVVVEKRIERFKPGKDQGVDGRFFSDTEREIVVQCKHYLKTGYDGLIPKLKNEEANKVKNLNPEKYIFATSLPLSRNNKKEIKNIFRPYIKRDDDIFGQEDLNSLLSMHPQIEEKHFKLWINSTTVLNRIINNAIKGRSEFELEKIRDNSRKYVPTKSHHEALKILKENNVLIISGEPGIGKTTLAENLCIYFVSKGFEFFDIEESLSEAESVYSIGTKQVFYFDDFLGSNYFEAIENKKDSHIVKFIDRVKKDKTKLFILTTRTNILNSGILHSSVFANKKIQKNEFLLTIEHLTKLDRARILYSHIWFSNLKEEFIDELYKDKRYKKIIEHGNFNPRLIEFITDVDRVNIVTCNDYWELIKETLRNPKDIWNDCFKIQNNAYVRNLVSLTVFNGGQISEKELRKSFSRIIKIENLKSDSHTEKDFNSTAQLATKSFLNRSKSSNQENYSLFSPSISDFVLGEYCEDIEKITAIFKSLGSVKSLKQLVSLQEEKIIPSTDILKIENAIFEDGFKQEKSNDYLIYISDFFIKDKSKKEKIVKFLQKIVKNPSYINEFSKLLGLLRKYWDDLEIGSYNFLSKSISNRYIEVWEIKDLAEFLNIFDIDDKDILFELEGNLEHYLDDELSSRMDEIDWSEYVESSIGEEGEMDFMVNSIGVKKELMRIVENLIDDFSSEVIDDLAVDIENLVDRVDIDESLVELMGSQEPDYEDFGGYAHNFDQEIDDLFERS